MATNPKLLKTIRQVHLYFGVFIAPALLFFAFTGFVQTFNLHETTRGSTYQPPKILVELGQLHKKQTLVVPARKPQSSSASSTKPTEPTQPRPDTPSARQKNLWPMKSFFALVCVGLVSSTFSGVYMAYKYSRRAAVVTTLWLAGVAVPILFTFF